MDCDFGPLNISTVTGTVSIGKFVTDLNALFSRAEPGPTIVSLRAPDGRSAKPLASMPCASKMVGEHIAVVVRLRSRPTAACHAKLFSNGTIHVTGARSSAEVEEAGRLLADALDIGTGGAFDVRTRMVNAHFRQSSNISRKALVDYICSRTKLKATFEPSISVEARVHFCFDARTAADPNALSEHDGHCACPSSCAFAPSRLRRCYRVIGIVHRTGTIMMSGSGTEAHLRRATELMKQAILAANRDQIRSLT